MIIHVYSFFNLFKLPMNTYQIIITLEWIKKDETNMFKIIIKHKAE